MALKKKTEKAAEKVVYNCEVIRANQIDDTCAAFDLKVNGITIYGMIYREYTNSNGEDGVMISFPSRKGTGKYKDKYFSHAWFPISLELKNQISNDVIHLLNEV